MARSDLIDARIAKLTSGFGLYVQAYDERVSFTSTQLAAHRACLALRRETGSLAAAVHDERFVRALREMLRAWKVGIRAGRLVPEEAFGAALRAALPRLEALEDQAIDAVDLPEDVGDHLFALVESLGIVENKAKIVAGTKALHHLLPDLVVPMDRKWTGRFFQFHLPEWQDPHAQRRIFGLAYRHFVQVARQVQPQQYVTGQGWRTCRTKIVDNALIGFCKVELGGESSVEVSGNRVTIEVEGDPPAKDGSNSIFKAGHTRGPFVRALLVAARRALEERPDFVPIESGPVGMDVVVYAPPGKVRGDATNYLGGIADVLEQKNGRVAIEHLGELTQVWVYGNDRQLKQVSYKEVAADRIGYRVVVWSL